MQATGTSHQTLQAIWRTVRAFARRQVCTSTISLDELLWKRP